MTSQDKMQNWIQQNEDLVMRKIKELPGDLTEAKVELAIQAVIEDNLTCYQKFMAAPAAAQREIIQAQMST